MGKKKHNADLDGILPEAARVPILGGKAEALVFPLGIKHLRKFNERISKVLMFAARNVKVEANADDGAIAAALVSEIGPLMMTDLFDLLEECVRFSPNGVKFDDLPQWEFPPILEKWIDESFGTPEKRDPWMRAIETTVARFTDEPFSISAMLSKDSSPEDGASPKSSESDKPESPIED